MKMVSLKRICLLGVFILCVFQSSFELSAQEPQGKGESKKGGKKSNPNDPPQWVKEPIEAPHLFYKTFESAILHAPVSYLIYLPSEYEQVKEKRYPVIYWLHGIGGAQDGLPAFVKRLTDAIEAGKTPPMIVVFVNGLSRGGYKDSEDGKQPVESITIKDLIPHIDSTYRTIARREGRMIEGFSMGGAGAAKWGFKYPELFCGVGIMAGALHIGKGPTPETSSLSSSTPDNAWIYVEKNLDKVREKTKVRIVVGEKDMLLETNTEFHQLLTKLNYEHGFDVIREAKHSHAPLYDGLGDKNWGFYREVFGNMVGVDTSSR